MTQRSERLERLVGEELGECCEADVEARLESLESFAADVPDAVDRDVEALKALGNDTRYTVVRLIRAAGRELCVCEITPVVDVSDSAVSHALSALHDAGLVTRRKDGTWRYYETTERAEALLDALDRTRGERR
ncbi:MAG: metalloregulator ArsR/SmtB family transcription factor [Haloarculaceae archaeon]